VAACPAGAAAGTGPRVWGELADGAVRPADLPAVRQPGPVAGAFRWPAASTGAAGAGRGPGRLPAIRSWSCG